MSKTKQECYLSAQDILVYFETELSKLREEYSSIEQKLPSNYKYTDAARQTAIHRKINELNGVIQCIEVVRAYLSV